MVGSELAVGAAAKGIEALITDTTKTGSSSVIGSLFKWLKEKANRVIFHASRKYIEKYQNRHCQISVLGMSEPVNLSAVYTDVKLLNSRDVLRYEVGALEDNFRQARFGGYSARRSNDERSSGIVIANEKKYLMVLGRPGAGKSTFLRKVGLEALRTLYYEGATYEHRLIPVLIELKRFDANDVDIAKFIAAEFETCGFPEAEKFAQDMLAQGKLLVLLDGLDEVPSANLNKVLTTIRDFVDSYDDNRFIASCRVAASGYRDDAFQRFSNVTMADFDDEQIQQFIRNWFGSEQDKERDTAGNCWEVLQKPENKASKELAHTPLLLTHLCRVYGSSQSFPKSRGKLYHEALRILLEEWKKNISRDAIYEGLSIELEEILLSEIAYDGMVVNQLFFAKRELSKKIRTFLSSNLNAPRHLDSEAVLNAIEVQQGILVEQAKDDYSFLHLTLQEYLAAQYVVDNNEWEAIVKYHLTDNHWREILLSLPGLMNDRSGTDRLLLAMEKQANSYLCSPELESLIRWSEEATHGSSGRFIPAVKKASVLMLVLSIVRDIDISCGDFSTGRELRVLHSLINALDHELSYSLELDILLVLDIAFVHTLDRASDIVYNYSSSKIFGEVDFRILNQHVEELGTRVQKIIDTSEMALYLRKFHYPRLLSTLNIEMKTAMLSAKDYVSLSNYFYICELMVRCKESAERVSPDVWAGIESRILTVPDLDCDADSFED